MESPRPTESRRCEQLALSISPKSLKEILNDATFTDLVVCFRSFSDSYLKSRTEIDVDFIGSSRHVVKVVEKDNLKDRYIFKLSLYKRMAEYKIQLVREILLPIMMSLQEDLDRMTVEEASVTLAQMNIRRNGLLCSAISQLFFAIEHCCKIACSLADPEFAEKIAHDDIIQHSDVFRTLKILGRQKYILDFDSLRAIYAYAIKTRMAADYTVFFYELYDAGGFLADILHPVANDIFNSHKYLLFECVGI